MNSTEDEAVAVPRYEPDERWVPVDRRWCGLDRRSLVPALAVLALAAVLTVVIPTVDDSVAYHDPVQPGDVIEVDGGVTFVPEPGWGITSGVRAGQPPASGDYPKRASLVDGDVEFALTVGEYHGDENALLDQFGRTREALTGGTGASISDDRSTVTTAGGDTGIVAPMSGLQTDGLVAAFVLGDRGVVVTVTGPADGDGNGDSAAAVTRMLSSISHTEQDAA